MLIAVMKIYLKLRILTIVLATFCTTLFARVWTDNQGRSIDAELVSVEGNAVSLDVRGKKFNIPLDTLSAKDQAFIKDLNKPKVVPYEQVVETPATRIVLADQINDPDNGVFGLKWDAGYNDIVSKLGKPSGIVSSGKVGELVLLYDGYIMFALKDNKLVKIEVSSYGYEGQIFSDFFDSSRMNQDRDASFQCLGKTLKFQMSPTEIEALLEGRKLRGNDKWRQQLFLKNSVVQFNFTRSRDDKYSLYKLIIGKD